jgi:branched-chain amino acid transport system permease protein
MGSGVGSSLGGMVLAAVAVLVLAAAIQMFLYEPLLRAGRGLLSTLITAVGIFTVLQAILVLPNSSQPIGISGYLPQVKSVSMLGAEVRGADVWGMGAELLAIAAVLAVLRFTSLGLFVRAAGDDGELAAVLGISLAFARVAAVVLGTALSLVAAFFWTWSAGVIAASAALTAALTATVAAFLGGIGKPSGALLGGVVLGAAHPVAARYLPGSWTDVVVYGGLLLVILVRPQGLLGTRLRDV